MATYGTDLVLIATGSDGESGTWVELASPYNAGGIPGIDPENFIQGSNSQSQALGNKFAVGFSVAFDAGSDVSGNFAAGDVVLTWVFFIAGSNLYDYATTGGHRFAIAADSAGSPSTAMDMWFISGDDRPPNPYGGWWNVAVDPTRTPDATTGGGNGGVYWYFGSVLEGIRAKISKGTPHAVDVMRYGRGEIYCTGTDATFTLMAADNDSNTNRWGLLQDTGGGTFLWKGLMSLGQAGTSTTFTDANKTILIDDAAKTYKDFNKIEIRHVDSTIDWTSISFSPLGTESPGTFDVIEDASVTMDSCTFSDMATFNLGSNTTISNTTFRGCEQVVQSGATLDTCTFDALTSGSTLVTTHLSGITDCSFFSGGSNNHAVELTDLGDGLMIWNNYLDGFIAYPSTGSTGNEAIYINVGSGTLTISVGAGYSPPSIRTAGAVVTVVAGQVTTTIEVVDRLGEVIVGARVYMITDDGGPIASGTTIFNDLTNASGLVTDVRELASDQPVSGWVRKGTTSPLYKTSPFSGTISNANGLSLTVLMISDE